MEKERTVRIPIRVAVVDDDPNARIYFKTAFESAADFEHAGSFSTAAEALSGIPNLQSHLILLDLGLRDLSGIECVKRLKQAAPHAKIVVVTGTHATNWVDDSIQAGAKAYLIKPIDQDQLLATLKFVAASRSVSELTESRAGDGSFMPPGSGLKATLTPREKEVLQGLAEGLLYKEIGEKLKISYSAVHKYQSNIFKKLRVTNRSEAIRIWLTGGPLLAGNFNRLARLQA